MPNIVETYFSFLEVISSLNVDFNNFFRDDAINASARLLETVYNLSPPIGQSEKLIRSILI